MSGAKLMLFVLLCSLFGWAQHDMYDPVFEATIAGATCKQFNNQMQCDYRVGKSLRFSIAGVGEETASILFQKADFENGDYFAKVGLLHGCVMVSRNIEVTAKELEKMRKARAPFVADLAFVSPRTGKVYRNWMDCGVAGVEPNKAAALRQKWETEQRAAIEQMEKAHREMEAIEKKWSEEQSKQPK